MAAYLYDEHYPQASVTIVSFIIHTDGAVSDVNLVSSGIHSEAAKAKFVNIIEGMKYAESACDDFYVDRYAIHIVPQ